MNLTVKVNRVPTLEMIHKYLEDNGYKLDGNSQFNVNRNFDVYYQPDDDEADLYVPAAEDFADYERRIVELLENLAIIEGRDSYSVWKDVENYR